MAPPFHIEQMYTGCLAQGAYYLTSDGEAAIIDPLRETSPYLDRLSRDGVTLKYIFETHFHADFVSGHVDLAKATGATIIYGPNADCGFGCVSAKDGEVFRLGKVALQVLHTPGHTLESSTFLLKDACGKDVAIFTGDTLFLGDVGRPDLAQTNRISKEDLAGMLYESLMTKIMPLADEVMVYPAHGAGSACGKKMMRQTMDTLGNQKRVNYALNQPSKEAFILAVLEGLTLPPAYFGMNVAMNKKGYASFEQVLRQGMRGLAVAEFEVIAEEMGALILDTRNADEFAKGFIPQSINIGLNGDFAPWVGALIVDVNQPMLLVAEPGKEEESVTRLARVGFDHTLGYLQGGLASWMEAKKDVDTIDCISAEQFASEIKTSPYAILDVRRETEYQTAHVTQAENKPLATINEWMKEYSPDVPFYLYCAAGYRSMIAASILHARGYRHFKNIWGGFNAIARTNAPQTKAVCS